MTETKLALASQAGHWYDRQGAPVYEVPRAKGDGMRATTLADARKLFLLPSVTLILRCAAAPGLEAWKARQLLESALTLPQAEGETLDDYALRVIEDSKAQGLKAREKGTELHAAIEQTAQDLPCDMAWTEHCKVVYDTLRQYGIDLFKGHTEHSFASTFGYGGKIDWHNDDSLIDFKTTAEVAKKKQLAWPEHCWQLAAYDQGIGGKRRRLLNVFVGIEDRQVRIHEWTMQEVEKAFQAFKALLRFWQITKEFK